MLVQDQVIWIGQHFTTQFLKAVNWIDKWQQIQVFDEEVGKSARFFKGQSFQRENWMARITIDSQV